MLKEFLVKKKTLILNVKFNLKDKILTRSKTRHLLLPAKVKKRNTFFLKCLSRVRVLVTTLALAKINCYNGNKTEKETKQKKKKNLLLFNSQDI